MSTKSTANSSSSFLKLLKEGIHCVKSLPASHEPLEPVNKTEWRAHSEKRAARLDEALAKGDLGIELLCGARSGVIAVDVEVNDRKLLKILPKSWYVKIGSKGETRFYKWSGEKSEQFFKTAPDGQEILQLEVLSDKTPEVPHLCALPPSIHPKTKEPYRWVGDPLSIEKLEVLPAAVIERLRKMYPSGEVEEVEESDKEVKDSVEPTGTAEDFATVKSALKAISADMGREKWVRIAFALKNSFGPVKGKRLFKAWSKTGSKWDDTCVSQIDELFSAAKLEGHGESIGLGSIYSMAKRAGWNQEAIEAAVRFTKLPEGDMPDDNYDEVPKKNYVDHPTEVAEMFLASGVSMGVMLCNETWWGYQEDKKSWVAIGDISYIDRQIEKFIYDQKLNWIKVPGSKEKKYFENKNIKHAHIVEVRQSVIKRAVTLEMPEIDTWLDADEQRRKPCTVAIQNGLLNIATRELYPHTPTFFNTGVIPIAYNPKAECPMWQEALKMYFKDMGGESCERALQLWFGFTLLSSRVDKHMACFVGMANSGKTTIVNVLSELIGQSYVIAGSNKSIQQGFGLTGADKAKLFFLDEYSIEKLSPTEVETLKRLTGGAKILINEKFEPMRYGRPTARLCLTTNTEPSVFHDPGAGLLKRMIFFCCRPIPESKKRANFMEELRGEMPGVLNWALEGARRLMQGEEMVQPEGRGADFHEHFRIAGRSPMQAFVEDMCSYDPQAETMYLSEIGRTHYRMFCEDRDYEVQHSSDVDFSRKFKDLIKATPKLKDVQFGKYGRNRAQATRGLRIKSVS